MEVVEKIMQAGIMLNKIPNIETYIALHGNTGCICVQICENKSLVYENRAFITNVEELCNIKHDLLRMQKAAEERTKAVDMDGE